MIEPKLSEKDFNDGEVVSFKKRDGKVRSGVIDYSYGDEQDGFIRIQEIFYETSDIPNTFYVPVEAIIL
jgi:hypothetical protein